MSELREDDKWIEQEIEDFFEESDEQIIDEILKERGLDELDS